MTTVAVIGGGLAGIAAARTLKRAGVEPFMIEAEGALGGRLRTLAGPDWIADISVPYATLRGTSIKALISEAGLGTEITTLQDAIVERSPEPPHPITRTVFADNHVVLKRGFDSFARAWEHQLPALTGLRVGAIRWRETHRDFILRDQASGGILRHPKSHGLIKADGVVLAVPGVAARAVVAGSACCEPLLSYFQKMRYEPGLAAVFITDAFDPGWCVLETPRDPDFQWIALEDRKGPGRAPQGRSVVVARLSAKAAATIRQTDDLAAQAQVLAALRGRCPDMPEQVHEQHFIAIAADFPAEGSRLRLTDAGVPTAPDKLPLGIAGDYLGDGTLDSTAATGIAAAQSVLRRLGVGS